MVMIKYDALSRGYDELYGDEQRAKYNVLHLYIESCANAVVLDAGSGTCLLYEYMLSQSITPKYYVGIDISEGMISVAKSKRLLGGAVDLIQADIDYLPLRDKCIDITLCITVLQNLPDPLKAVEELSRVTRRSIILSYPRKSPIEVPGVALRSRQGVKDFFKVIEIL